MKKKVQFFYRLSLLDIIEYYFSNQELCHFINSLRYESPYGTSVYGYSLELLCKYDIHFQQDITKFMNQFIWQYVMDERDLAIQSDG